MLFSFATAGEEAKDLRSWGGLGASSCAIGIFEMPSVPQDFFFQRKQII